MSSQADLVSTPDEAIAAIWALIAGAQNTQLIYVAAKLGLADVFHEGPRNADDIAAELGVNALTLRRLLRGLVNRGLVAEGQAGIFSLTALGQYLRADAPGNLRGHAIRFGEIQYPAWGSLLYAVETGQSAFEHAHGTDFFGYLAANPAVNNAFNEGMTARAESIVDGIVDAYDFSPFARIVDVGGGAGVLLSRILEVNPASTGILYDIAAVTQKASAYLVRRGLSGRVEVIDGDFFATVPRGDLLVLEAILHDWDDERAALILRQCRKALEPTGRILIIEDVLPDKADGGMPLIEIDLMMLVIHNGRERTLADYEELLVREGFRLESVGETASSYKLIAASPAPEKLPADAEAKDVDGSMPRAVERFQVYRPQTRGGVEPDAVAEQNRQDVHQDLVHEPPLQALTGHVGTEDFEVLPACGVQCLGDRFPDVTAEVRDLRVRRVRRPMGEDEEGPVKGVAFIARR